MRYEEQLLRLHRHLCPRQVLGVRMGELAGEMLGLALPQSNKRLFVFVETDGCFADGIMVATGCSLGHRTLRLVDEGKIAATFVDTVTQPERGIRIHPNPLARSRAQAIETVEHQHGRSRWHAQLAAYQVMPAEELLVTQEVVLTTSTRIITSRSGIRVKCSVCGEEIINEREVIDAGPVRCRTCAGDSYYTPHNATNVGS